MTTSTSITESLASEGGSTFEEEEGSNNFLAFLNQLSEGVVNNMERVANIDVAQVEEVLRPPFLATERRKSGSP